MSTLISFCLSGRNDSYGGSFLWRLTTTLNMLGTNLAQLGRVEDAEVVVTDWASDTPLQSGLRLNEAARRITRFITVSPAVGKLLQQDSEFPAVLAINAAIRRSRGTYAACADSDCLCTRGFLDGLLQWLGSDSPTAPPPAQCLILAPRRHIPALYVSTHPGPAELDQYTHRFGRFLYCDTGHPTPFDGAGMLLMHRDLWHQCGGFDQRLIYWGRSDTDLGLRVTQKYPRLNLADRGLYLYHLDHQHVDLVAEPETNRRLNPLIHNETMNPNGAHWGLEEYDLIELAAHTVSVPAVAASESALSEPIQNGRLWFAFVVGLYNLLIGKLSRLPRGIFIVRGLRRLHVVLSMMLNEAPSQWPTTLRRHWGRYQGNRKRRPDQIRHS